MSDEYFHKFKSMLDNMIEEVNNSKCTALLRDYVAETHKNKVNIIINCGFSKDIAKLIIEFSYFDFKNLASILTHKFSKTVILIDSFSFKENISKLIGINIQLFLVI